MIPFSDGMTSRACGGIGAQSKVEKRQRGLTPERPKLMRAPVHLQVLSPLSGVLGRRDRAKRQRPGGSRLSGRGAQGRWNLNSAGPACCASGPAALAAHLEALTPQVPGLHVKVHLDDTTSPMSTPRRARPDPSVLPPVETPLTPRTQLSGREGRSPSKPQAAARLGKWKHDAVRWNRERRAQGSLVSAVIREFIRTPV